MATNWVLGKVSDALAPTVSNAASAAGSFAGGAVSAVGNSINGVGEGINNSIRRYGDGAKDYGNSIMDWTKAPSARSQTASNPLGLQSGAGAGKSGVTSPKIYSAPATSKPASQKLMTTSKTTGSRKKVVDVPKKTSTTTKAITGPKPVAAKGPQPVKSVKGIPGKPGGTVAPRRTAQPVKASTASARSTRVPSSQATNPLGLS